MTNYRSEVIKATRDYYEGLNNADFSHNFDHALRVERLAMVIGAAEGADLEVLESACLLFDVARGLEDKGLVKDHAEAGSDIARDILTAIGFPKKKMENVCHSIFVHRKSHNRAAETLEAKILQDADYLDAMVR